MFRYDNEVKIFETKNFKEEILGNEIRQEEVADILVSINNRFMLKDASCLKTYEKQIFWTMCISSILLPVLFTITAVFRKGWAFFPQGKCMIFNNFSNNYFSFFLYKSYKYFFD
jgi:hypothetical protein